MDRQAIRRRLRLIRSEMGRKKVDCLIVTNPANVTYVTGFSGDDSWASVTKGTVHLITDSRYTEQARKECLLCRVVERTTPIAEVPGRLLNKLASVRTVSVEKSTSIAVFEALRRNTNARLRTSGDIVEQLRSTKDDGEIAAIKTAASIAARALEITMRLLTAGMTENELAGILNLEIRRLGASNSFDTIVAFGPNASRPHHQPSSRKLKERDTILIDFGAKYRGYCCDITRCFAVGGLSAFYKRVYDVVTKAQAAAINKVKAGVEMLDVDTAARQVISNNDLPVYGHGTGHGVGLEIHELPAVNAQSKGKLKAGEVVTIEPAVYIPGKLAVRIEDDILVTQTGCKVLTRECANTLVQLGV